MTTTTDTGAPSAPLCPKCLKASSISETSNTIPSPVAGLPEFSAGDRIALEALNHRIDHTAAIARLISIHCDIGVDYTEAMRGIAETLNEIAERVDRSDAPFMDMEEDDWPGDPLDIFGEAPTDDGRTLLPTLPLYAVDQTKGPTNEHQAYRAYQAAEQGLVSNGRGGWQVGGPI